jgi:sugar/nucleoside kinase (ribokinase family)
VAIVSDGFPQRHTGAADLRTALRRMAARGPRLTAATLGGGGALACAGRRILYVPALRVPVVDTTSAGDLFHAGCLYGLLHEWPVERALRFATAAAALACTVSAAALASWRWPTSPACRAPLTRRGGAGPRPCAARLHKW